MSDSTTLVERLFQHASEMPEHCAVASSSVTLSYASLACHVCAQMEHFHQLGISTDICIGVDCSNEIQHLIISLAASALGCDSFTLPTFESAQQRQALLDRFDHVRIVDASDAIDLESDWHGGSPLETLTTHNGRLIFSTSGTTGQAKLVVHHSNDLVWQAPRHILSSEERFACLASIEHNFAKRHRLYCIAQGATNLFFEDTSQNFVTECQALNLSVLHLSVFQAQDLLSRPDLDSLPPLLLKLGGSHVPSNLRMQLRQQISARLQCGYGTTETGAIAFTQVDDINDGESVGIALPGLDLRIVDEKRQTVPAGQTGEIAIRGKGMFGGYLGQEALSESRLSDHWFYSGDIGWLDENHRLHLCGRADDMFVFNSMNIYPQEIESQLRQQPGVIDAAVLPKHSTVHGDIPVALVVFAEDSPADVRRLKKSLRSQLGLRSPRQYLVVDKIPRTGTGKINRRDALALIEGHKA